MTAFARLPAPRLAGLGLPALAIALALGGCSADQPVPDATGHARPAADDSHLLDPLFTDHMVIQRDQPAAIWGQAEPGSTVTVRLGVDSQNATADAAGRWQAEFGPHTAGEQLVLEVITADGVNQRIEDVLVGDVWLCSGQSNMEFPVERALNPGSEISGPHNPAIRLLTIAHDSRAALLADHANPDVWRVSASDSVRDFSAVCYFFARELQARVDVPMGLIDASWGGSQIEAWISAGGLRSTGDFDTALDTLALYATDPAAASAGLGVEWEDWWQTTAGTTPWSREAVLADPGQPAPTPMGDWRSWGIPEMDGHLDMVWFTRQVELDAGQAGQDAWIDLGGIDEVDASWVNGEFIGSTFGWGTARTYALPQGGLQAGTNTIAINVLNNWGAGGMVGPDEAVRLRFADGSEVQLAGNWRYARVAPSIGSPPRAPWESVGGLTGMYNGMIAPLEQTRIAGMIWYQGESNTGRADAYEELLNTLLADWRDQFGSDMPALIVQLANFGALADQPVESGWARVRDAQRRVAETDPRAGLVITIDIGDRLDIHPANKQEVGRRAARAALHVLHDAQGTGWGARPRAARQDGGRIHIRFDDVENGLYAMSAEAPGGFETCGANGCQYARARLIGDRVVLTTDAEQGAVTHVRYCWADSPICQLYDGAGLPVGPFELAVTRE
ncbi:sialate O-acetylesterase [Maricaulis sp.]|uniref:sialate O-acetylesterase n=1 Tax=Maricaulis sp. TaxID=1486257 RepID=UPI0025B7E21E|nr:sialate O-acetylesterase [Maricaulis sp.]